LTRWPRSARMLSRSWAAVPAVIWRRRRSGRPRYSKTKRLRWSGRSAARRPPGRLRRAGRRRDACAARAGPGCAVPAAPGSAPTPSPSLLHSNLPLDGPSAAPPSQSSPRTWLAARRPLSRDEEEVRLVAAGVVHPAAGRELERHRPPADERRRRQVLDGAPVHRLDDERSLLRLIRDRELVPPGLEDGHRLAPVRRRGLPLRREGAWGRPGDRRGADDVLLQRPLPRRRSVRALRDRRRAGGERAEARVGHRRLVEVLRGVRRARLEGLLRQDQERV